MKNIVIALALAFGITCAIGCRGAEPAQQQPQTQAPAKDDIGPISVTGQAAENPNHPRLQAGPAAKRGALIDAYRKLLEQIKGLHVDATTQVRDFITEEDQIHARSGGFLQNIGAVGDAVDNGDGSWTITLTLSPDQVRKLLETLNQSRGQ